MFRMKVTSCRSHCEDTCRQFSFEGPGTIAEAKLLTVVAGEPCATETDWPAARLYGEAKEGASLTGRITSVKLREAWSTPDVSGFGFSV